jgi:MFS family permease
LSIVLKSKSKFYLNRVVVYLTFSDIFTWGLYLIITAIAGIYFAEKFEENAVSIIGIGTSMFYLARVVAQIPIGILTDKIRRDKDDLIILILGNVLMGVPYLIYPIIESASAFFTLQFIIGIGGAMNLVNWRKLFAENLDKGKEGYTYAAYDTILSIAMVIFGALAGEVASKGKNYFDLVIILIGVFTILSSIFPLLVFTEKKRKSRI